MSQPLDVLVLGGGPAGMSAALTLGRARLRTLVLNAETPRSAVSAHTHGLYTRDGATALELLAIAKAQLAPYPTVAYQSGTATSVARTEAGFTVTAADGSAWSTRRLVLATGYRSDLDAVGIPGLDAVYGRSVFPCPFCDGFELADRTLAVFVGGMEPGMVEHYLMMIGQLSSPDRVVFTNGQPLDPTLAEALDARGLPAFDAHIAALVHDGGTLGAVRLFDGTEVPVGAGFLGSPHAVPTVDFAHTLGAETTTNPMGMTVVTTNDFGESSVSGLFVVGDARDGFVGLARAVAHGAMCGAGIVHGNAQQQWHG